jgi:Abnormal spindle-like microcephaly-assoc'd, ASPM-SPD-2-Hydin
VQTVTVTNAGAIALVVSSIAIDGDFSESDNCQSGSINAGAGCAIQVTFAPAQAGARTGDLTINANVAGGEIPVSLSGTGAGASGVSLLPSTMNFGSVALGSTSSTLQVTVQNASAASVAVTSFTVTAPFELAGNGCSTTLAPNSDCQLSVEFAPAQTGTASGTLTVVDSAGTQTASLSGVGAAPPTDTLSPSSLSFPGTIVGQTSAAQTISLANGGGVPLTAIAASVSGPFQLASNCGSQLAAASSCSVSAKFVPTAAGPQTGSLTVSDALRSQSLPLNGTGLQPPILTVNPSSVTFLSQQVGVSSSPATLTISNTGGAPLANVGFQFTGPAGTSFAIGATTCGATLNNGSSCTVQLIFNPENAGANVAALVVSSSTLGVTAVQVPLSGTGQAANGLNVSPSQMIFTVATLGQPSAAQTATISNAGTANASGFEIAISPPFSLAQSACSGTLAAASSCSVGVIFTPVANGTVSGALTVTSTTSNAAVIALTGVGGAAGALQFQPAVLSFPSTGVGSSSSAQTVTLTNSGQVALAALTLAVSGSFQIAGTTCTSVLAAGTTCSADINFSPATAGQQAGSLTVNSTALASPAQATLSGMGFDFSATSTGSSSQTIASGQTASFTLKLGPLSGSSGTFSFTCGQLPANASCSFNPATETVPANTTGTVTVLIATGQSTSASRVPGWAKAAALCGLFLLPFVRIRHRRALWLAAVLALLITSVSSCTGSGGGTGGGSKGGGQGTTPPGTYSISVVIASSGVSHTVMLTLTVD